MWSRYGPDKKLYYTTDNTRVKANRGIYTRKCSAWHNLSLQGDKAQTMPGEWQLKVYFDNDLLGAKTFFIVAEKDEIVAAPPVASHRIFPDD